LAFAINHNDINGECCALLAVHIAAHSEVVNNVVFVVEVVVELTFSLTAITFTAAFLCVYGPVIKQISRPGAKGVQCGHNWASRVCG
jgi:hypothetical protein